MFILTAKGMLKSQLKTFLSLHDPILLDGDAYSGPIGFFLTAKDRQMSLLEQLDLVAHVPDAEGSSGTLRDALDREVKPCLVGGCRIRFNRQLELR